MTQLFGGRATLAAGISELLDRGVDVLTLVGTLFASPAKPGVRMVFLKQFRDAADPTRACYQRVVCAQAHVEGGSVHGAGPLQGEYVLRLSDFDSHPIARDLGLRAGENPVELAFRLAFSFTMQPGEEV